MMKIYQVRVYGDIEGRSLRTIGYFTEVDLAKAILNSFGSDADASITEISAYSDPATFYAENPTMDPSRYPHQHEVQHVLKVRALAKLTPEERKALGV